MKLQMEVVGLDELERSFSWVKEAVDSPGAGVADLLEKAINLSVVPNARRRVWALFNTTGRFPRNIKTRRVNEHQVDVVVDAPYGAVHEYGGTFTITPRQRAFFWHMFAETENGMWRALALSKTYTIPARPYLRPAIDLTKHEVAMSVAAQLRTKLKKRFT